MKKYLFALVLCIIPAISTVAGEPPPLCLMDGSCKAAPSNPDNYVGPRIGIDAEPYSHKGVKGVLVVEDESKRELWFLTKNKDRKTATFRVNKDVILKVNDVAVRSSADVLKNTRPSWNKLTIKDLSNNQTGEYWVDLPSKES